MTQLKALYTQKYVHNYTVQESSNHIKISSFIDSSMDLDTEAEVWLLVGLLIRLRLTDTEFTGTDAAKAHS